MRNEPTAEISASSSQCHPHENVLKSKVMPGIEDIPLPDQFSAEVVSDGMQTSNDEGEPMNAASIEGNTRLTVNGEGDGSIVRENQTADRAGENIVAVNAEESSVAVNAEESSVAVSVDESSDAVDADGNSTKDGTEAAMETSDSKIPSEPSEPPPDAPALSRIQLLIKSKTDQLKSQGSAMSFGGQHDKSFLHKFGIGKQKVKFSMKMKSTTGKVLENVDNGSLEEEGRKGKSSDSTQQRPNESVRTEVIKDGITKMRIPEKVDPVSGKNPVPSYQHDQKHATAASHPAHGVAEVKLSPTDSNTPSSEPTHGVLSQVVSYPGQALPTTKSAAAEKLSYEADSTIPDKQTDSQRDPELLGASMIILSDCG